MASIRLALFAEAAEPVLDGLRRVVGHVPTGPRHREISL